MNRLTNDPDDEIRRLRLLVKRLTHLEHLLLAPLTKNRLK